MKDAMPKLALALANLYMASCKSLRAHHAAAGDDITSGTASLTKTNHDLIIEKNNVRFFLSNLYLDAPGPDGINRDLQEVKRRKTKSKRAKSRKTAVPVLS